MIIDRLNKFIRISGYGSICIYYKTARGTTQKYEQSPLGSLEIWVHGYCELMDFEGDPEIELDADDIVAVEIVE